MCLIRLIPCKRRCILTEMGSSHITTCVLSRGYSLLLIQWRCSLRESVWGVIPAEVTNTETAHKTCLCHVCFISFVEVTACYVILVPVVLLLYYETGVSWEETWDRSNLAIWLLFAGNLVIMRVIFLVPTRRYLYIVRKKIYQYIEEENRVIQNRIW